MLDDIEIELETNQEEPTDVVEDSGSKVQEETPAGNGEKHTEDEVVTEESDTFEEASKEEETPKQEPAGKPGFDEDLDAWAEKAGHGKPETDRERKAMQLLRDNQREFTRDRQAKKSVDKIKEVITSEEKAVGIEKEDIFDPLEKRMADLESKNKSEHTLRLQSEFFTANSISEDTSSVMADILKEKVANANTPEDKQRVIDYWSDPNQLKDWFDLARARELNASKEALVDEATQKERERIAKEQRAGGVSRSARSSVPTKQATELEKLWAED